MDTWIIGRNSVRHHCQKNAIQTFYSHLNMEDITDAAYTLAKKVFKGLKNIKHLYEYHDFYVQSDTLLFGDVFNNFWSMCLKIYEIDSEIFFSVPGLASQATLKRLK